MSRPSFRRKMTLESLEKREVLSAAPNATAQYTLELLNLARTNPGAAAQWISNNITPDDTATLAHYNVNLQQELQEIASATPQPPLAWNDQLGSAALSHSQDMASNNFQSHTGSDGSSPQDRLNSAGYANATSSGEDAFAYATSVDEAMKAFLLDWGVADKGHRRNILQPGVNADDSFREVGIGIVTTGNDGSSTVVGPNVVTIDFASRPNPTAQLLGVAFNDNDGNNFYGMGEGQGGVEIDATNLATGQVSSTWTAPAGGYQMPLNPGSYSVTAKVNGTIIDQQTVAVSGNNVQVDINLTNPQHPPVAQVAAPAPAPAPVATPAPVAAPTPAPSPVVVNTPMVSAQVSASTPAVAATVTSSSMLNPLSWITTWSAYRNGVRIS